jgi:hypothetical protein
MSDVHRIEGIKYNFDRLTDEEVEGIRANLIEAHARITGEIALLDECLFVRNEVQLTEALDYGRVE